MIGMYLYLSRYLLKNYNIDMIGKDTFISHYFCRFWSIYVEISR